MTVLWFLTGWLATIIAGLVGLLAFGHRLRRREQRWHTEREARQVEVDRLLALKALRAYYQSRPTVAIEYASPEVLRRTREQAPWN